MFNNNYRALLVLPLISFSLKATTTLPSTSSIIFTQEKISTSSRFHHIKRAMIQELKSNFLIKLPIALVITWGIIDFLENTRNCYNKNSTPDNAMPCPYKKIREHKKMFYWITWKRFHNIITMQFAYSLNVRRIVTFFVIYMKITVAIKFIKESTPYESTFYKDNYSFYFSKLIINELVLCPIIYILVAEKNESFKDYCKEVYGRRMLLFNVIDFILFLITVHNEIHKIISSWAVIIAHTYIMQKLNNYLFE